MFSASRASQLLWFACALLAPRNITGLGGVVLTAGRGALRRHASDSPRHGHFGPGVRPGTSAGAPSAASGTNGARR